MWKRFLRRCSRGPIATSFSFFPTAVRIRLLFIAGHHLSTLVGTVAFVCVATIFGCLLLESHREPVDGGVGVRQDSNNFLVVVALGKGAAVEVDFLGVYCVPRQQFQFNLINRSVLIHFIPVFIHHVALALGREGGREEGEGGM